MPHVSYRIENTHVDELLALVLPGECRSIVIHGLQGYISIHPTTPRGRPNGNSRPSDKSGKKSSTSAGHEKTPKYFSPVRYLTYMSLSLSVTALSM